MGVCDSGPAAKEEPASDLRDALALSWWAATSVPCPHLSPLLGRACDDTHQHYQAAAAGYFRVVCQEGSDALLLRGGSRDISLISLMSSLT